MASKALPSPEVLRQLLRYEPDTGKLFWRERAREWFTRDRLHGTWNTRFANKHCGIMSEGRILVSILGRKHHAGPVIWALHYGTWPSGLVDHINGDPTNNTLANLRECSRSENNKNRCSRSGASSQWLGVSWHCTAKKWRATIIVNGKQKNLGHYANPEDAARAYDAAAAQYHGEFARLNMP